MKKEQLKKQYIKQRIERLEGLIKRNPEFSRTPLLKEELKLLKKHQDERPMVSVGIIINGLVDQGFNRESLKVMNNCLILDTTYLNCIKIAEIYKGEIDLNDVAQWFNINP